jgi:hypothetical protein
MFVTSFQLITFFGHAQYYPPEPQPELAMGIKIVTGQIIYGRNQVFNSDPASIALQPGIRYDYPQKLYSKGMVPHYIDLVVESGFLFCKARVFDTAYTDPVSNRYIIEHSSNTTYLPLYFGAYNIATISVGAELFFWKGLGKRDIWGAKFLSLGYNARQFRINVAGEFYAQIKNGKNSGIVFSIDFLWKMIKGG